MITEKRQCFLLGAEPWGKSSCRSEPGATAQHGAAGLSTATFIPRCLQRSVLNRQSSGLTSLRGLNYLLSPSLQVMAGITGHRGAPLTRPLRPRVLGEALQGESPPPRYRCRTPAGRWRGGGGLSARAVAAVTLPALEGSVPPASL